MSHYDGSSATPKGVVGKIPDGYYTRAQVSSLTGISASTLTRWRKSGHFVPERAEEFGSIRVHLYSEAQLRRLQTNAPYQRTDKEAA